MKFAAHAICISVIIRSKMVSPWLCSPTKLPSVVLCFYCLVLCQNTYRSGRAPISWFSLRLFFYKLLTLFSFLKILEFFIRSVAVSLDACKDLRELRFCPIDSLSNQNALLLIWEGTHLTVFIMTVATPLSASLDFSTELSDLSLVGWLALLTLSRKLTGYRSFQPFFLSSAVHHFETLGSCASVDIKLSFTNTCTYSTLSSIARCFAWLSKSVGHGKNKWQNQPCLMCTHNSWGFLTYESHAIRTAQTKTQGQ